MQTLLDPGLRPASNPHHALDPIQAETPPETPSPRRRRNEGGFTMNELLVVLIIIGTLGLIGTGVYFLFIRDARDTVLNANIQTAAEEIQSVLALQPSLATDLTALETEMTGRTNFVWDSANWDFQTGDDANTIQLQFIGKAAAAFPFGTAAPQVEWGVNAQSAVRLRLQNSENEWRCALIVLSPSSSELESIGAAAVPAVGTGEGPQKAAEMRGAWYDGGTSVVAGGRHDCSPVGVGGTPVAAWDHNVPDSAQEWNIAVATVGTTDSTSAADAANQLDASSTASPAERTLHRSPSALDSNA